MFCLSLRRLAVSQSQSFSLPIAGELQGALADGFAEGLVGGEGVEPFGLRLALVAQEVNQTQRLTLRSQLRSPRPSEIDEKTRQYWPATLF